MKVVFEANLADASCIDWYIDLSFDYAKQDVEKELRQITGKYVRVTIEAIKEPAKNSISAMPQMAMA